MWLVEISPKQWFQLVAWTGGFTALVFCRSVSGVDFDQDIRPILSDNCFQCHGPDAAQREAELRLDTKSGLFGDLDDYKVVAPGDLEKSELVYRIAHEDPEERMPPEDADRHLKDSEIALIKTWISEGAIWEQHWSLVPPERPQFLGPGPGYTAVFGCCKHTPPSTWRRAYFIKQHERSLLGLK